MGRASAVWVALPRHARLGAGLSTELWMRYVFAVVDAMHSSRFDYPGLSGKIGLVTAWFKGCCFFIAAQLVAAAASWPQQLHFDTESKRR